MESLSKSLRPDETIQKVLISTTSRINGEFSSEKILIAQAWQHYSQSAGMFREKESPVSRNAFIVAFRTEQTDKKPGLVIPDYSPIGEIVCSFLSVLYGKRFDNHGLTEGSGFYNTPDLSIYNSICNHRLPFNSHEKRKCFGTPLNLTHFSILEKIFTDTTLDKEFISKLKTACKFYLQALQNAEQEPEIAYLHLIMAGEILSGHFHYKNEEVIDKQMLDNLKAIRNELNNGEKVASQIAKRLLSIRRRFIKTLCSLVDDDFFENHESKANYACLNSDDFEQRIGAAYDLRSMYTHTGIPFGNWVRPDNRSEDIQLGKPIVGDKEYAKVLARAPRFSGLERVIRYSILKFMCTNGFSQLEDIAKSS